MAVPAASLTMHFTCRTTGRSGTSFRGFRRITEVFPTENAAEWLSLAIPRVHESICVLVRQSGRNQLVLRHDTTVGLRSPSCLQYPASSWRHTTGQWPPIFYLHTHPSCRPITMACVIIAHLSPRVGKSDLLRLFDTVGGLAGSRVGKIELCWRNRSGRSPWQVGMRDWPRLSTELNCRDAGSPPGWRRTRSPLTTESLGSACEHLPRLFDCSN